MVKYHEIYIPDTPIIGDFVIVETALLEVSPDQIRIPVEPYAYRVPCVEQLMNCNESIKTLSASIPNAGPWNDAVC